MRNAVTIGTPCKKLLSFETLIVLIGLHSIEIAFLIRQLATGQAVPCLPAGRLAMTH